MMMVFTPQYISETTCLRINEIGVKIGTGYSLGVNVSTSPKQKLLAI